MGLDVGFHKWEAALMMRGLGDVNHWFRLGLCGIPVIIIHQSRWGTYSVAPQVTPHLLGGERLAPWNQSCSRQEGGMHCYDTVLSGSWPCPWTALPGVLHRGLDGMQVSNPSHSTI